MGNQEEPIDKVSLLILQTKERIKARKYFELGDDPDALEEIESQIDEINRLIAMLNELYSSKPMPESNLYYASVSIAHQAQDFLRDVRMRGKGSNENTIHLLGLLDELDRSARLLGDGDRVEIDETTKPISKQIVEKPETSVGLKDRTSSPKTSPNYEHLVFISYAWGEEREEIVNQLDEALQKRGIKIIRDKRDLRYKGSIKEFMERIGHGNCVIVIISDKYLRSRNCMFELVEIAENRQFQDRVFPIVLSDANIYDPVKRIDYVKYWEDKRSELAEALKTLDPANLQGLREDMDMYHRIRDNISGLTSTLTDMNALTPEMHRDSNFSHLYDALERRMRKS